MTTLAPGTAAAFFAVSVLLALSPGPDNVFVLMQSAMRGRAAGLLVVLGLCSGLLVHTAAVAFGLATLFAASTLAFTALKLAGALYLIYLAWQAWRAPATPLAAQPDIDAGQLYRRGIVMNVTNPKVSIFFLAFLPQFVAADRGSVALQVLWLGFVFMLATLLVFGAIALTAGTLGQALARSARAQLLLNRAAALVFVALALRLATVQR
ncbi:MAG: LysE family translocator [Pseudomonadota bacterium]